MSRPMPAPLQAELEGSPLAGECLVLRARNGTVMGFTSLTRPQTIDLSADGGPGATVCSAGMILSALTLSCGLDASYFEAQGPLVVPLTRAAVEGGAWTFAEAWLVRISPGVAGYAPLLYGRVSEPKVEDPRWVFQVRNEADRYNQPLEVTVGPYCRWEYGDPDTCTAVPTEIAATVIAVTDAMRFAVSYAGTHASGFFNLGQAEFTSGELSGVIAEKLFSFTSLGAGAGTLVTREPLPEAPAIGDTLLLRDGCALTRAACIAHLGSARTFGGEPDAPTSEQMTTYAVPGTQ